MPICSSEMNAALGFGSIRSRFQDLAEAAGDDLLFTRLQGAGDDRNQIFRRDRRLALCVRVGFFLDHFTVLAANDLDLRIATPDSRMSRQWLIGVSSIAGR